MVAHDIWIADGPEIAMSLAGLAVPFPTRMTLVRLPNDDLWLHSPIAPETNLLTAVEKCGRVRFLVAPNTLHYWWLQDWQLLFPTADAYTLPNLAQRAKRKLPPCKPLTMTAPEAWQGVIDQVVVEGNSFSEVVFFHKASRTLILTDLIENFELTRVKSAWMRWLIRLGGVYDPFGKTPRDMQFAFSFHREQLRRSVETMLNWEPSRVLFAHGRWYERDVASELHRAFRWIL
jgi:hypothetical protein